jgi:predicted dehydrogenase
MIAVCKEHGVKLQIAFPCRFHPAYTALREEVQSGKLGAVKAIVGTNRGSMIGGWFCQPEESGGGSVMDHTVHVVDLMRSMLNSEVAEVYAEYDRKLYEEYEVEDIGLVTMKFENGVIATLDCSWSRPEGYPTWGDVTMEVVGEEGVSKMNMFAQDLAKYPRTNRKTEWIYWGDDMDYLLLESFVSAITADTEPITSGKDGLEALRVTLAAYESGKRHEPVMLRS